MPYSCVENTRKPGPVLATPAGRVDGRNRCALRALVGAGSRTGTTVLLELPEFGRLLLDVVQATAHVEGLLRVAVELAVADPLERLDVLVQRDERPLDAGELRRGEGVLRQEPLDPAGPGDRDLVLLGQLVDPQDRDDVLQFLVALQD